MKYINQCVANGKWAKNTTRALVKYKYHLQYKYTTLFSKESLLRDKQDGELNTVNKPIANGHKLTTCQAYICSWQESAGQWLQCYSHSYRLQSSTTSQALVDGGSCYHWCSILYSESFTYHVPKFHYIKSFL